MPARIRLASPDDGGALAEIYAPAVVARATSFETVPPDAAEMAARVQRVLARTPWLVAESADGTVVGYAYAGPHRGDRPAYRWSVEVSAYVSDRVHRGGVGRALYSALFDLLRLQGFRNAYAGVTLPNEASERFHRAMGFELVGVYERVGYKLGAWHDVAWSALPLAPHDHEPEPPLALPELVDRPEFAAVLDRASANLRLE